MDGLKGKRPLPLGPVNLLPLFAAGLAVAARLPLSADLFLVFLMLLATPWSWRRQRLSTLHSLLAIAPRSVSRITPEDLGIEMSRVAREKIPPGEHFPPYIPRSKEDDRIRTCLADHRFVIVTGNPYAGKTRSALEAIRNDHQGKVLLVRPPLDGDNPLRDLLAQPWLVPRRTRCMVFVDKLDRYLDGLEHFQVKAWLDARPRAALVTTMSLNAKQEATDPERPSSAGNRRLLSHSRTAQIKDAISGLVLEQAREEYGDDPELAKIGSYLGGGQVIEDRYWEAKAARPVAWQLTTAAIVVAQAGVGRGLRQEELITLASKMDLLDAGATDEELETAIEYCKEEPEGIHGMLRVEISPAGEQTLRANSVLVRAATEAAERPPVPLNLQTWEQLADALAHDHRTCVELARGAWLQAMDRDGPNRELIEFARALLRSDAARLSPDTEMGRVALDLYAAMTKVIEGEEDQLRRPPFSPPAPLPTPDAEQVRKVIDRREVSNQDDLFQPGISPYFNPPDFYANSVKRNALRFFLLFGLDLIATTIGIALGIWVFNRVSENGEELQSVLRGGLIGVALLLVLFAYLGLYRPDSRRAKLQEIVNGMAIAAFVVAVVAIVQGFETHVLLLVLFCGIGIAVAVFLARAIYDWGSGRWVEERGLHARTLFVAPAKTARLSADLVHLTSSRPMQFVGFVSSEEESDPAQLSTLAEFEQVLGEFYVDHVILADPALSAAKRSELATICHTHDVRVEVLPWPDEIFQEAGAALSDLSVPLIEIPPPYLSPFGAFIKRSFDLTLGLAFFLVSLPLTLLAAVVLCVLNGGRNPLVTSFRLGRNGKSFSMYQFHLRAKNPFAEAANEVLRGLQLRKLPQLVNVVRGQMSLVGPRPLDGPEFSQQKEVKSHRYAVKPGITGLWQVTPEKVEPRDKFAPMILMGSLDLVYCRRWSPLVDFTIILRTPGAIARSAIHRLRENASTDVT